MQAPKYGSDIYPGPCRFQDGHLVSIKTGEIFDIWDYEINHKRFNDYVNGITPAFNIVLPLVIHDYPEDDRVKP